MFYSLHAEKQIGLVHAGKDIRKRGSWVRLNSPSLSLIFYKNFITFAKEINSLRILLLLNFST